MCHGQNAEGLVGPALVPGNYDDPKFAAFIEETTRYGSKTHLSMPGFSNKVGGPLTDGQIKTLMSFLKEKSQSMTSEPIPQSPSGGM
jgi:hypothetical protein